MTELNRLDRMNQIITDKYETPLPSKIIWRQARAMEAIDTYRLAVIRQVGGKVKIVPDISRADIPGDFSALPKVFNRVDDKYFDTAFDAVEHFLRVLEEVKAKR